MLRVNCRTERIELVGPQKLGLFQEMRGMGSECPGEQGIISKDATMKALKVVAPRPGPSRLTLKPHCIAATIATATSRRAQAAVAAA